MVQATVVCAICENNEIYLKEKKNAFHNAFHVPIFFPGKTGIPKIKDLKDVLGDVCCLYMTLIVYILMCCLSGRVKKKGVRREGDRLSNWEREGQTDERKDGRNSTMKGGEQERERGSKKGQWNGGREGTRKQSEAL